MATLELLPTWSDTLRRRIHILSVIDDLHFGGDEYRLLAFAQTLDGCRFKHTILTLMKGDQETAERHGSMREHFRRAGIRLLHLEHAQDREASGLRVSKLSAFKNKVLRLRELIQEEDIDVLDVHLAPPNPVCAAATLVTGVPFVVTLYQVNTMRHAKFWLAGQFNLGNAALLVTDSNVQAAKIREWLLRRPPICVIPNGTPPPRSTLTREEIFQFLNIPPETAPIIIGQISRLVPYKGHVVLIEAAKKVLEQYPECFFLLVGYEQHDTGYRDSLLQRASELGVAERIRITGYPGPIGDIWGIVDIHVHASLLDSLPNALLEAMSLGKPSVATAVGGIPEAIVHGVNGLLVPPSNKDELARYLLLMLKDTNLRTTLGQGAHTTYCSRYRPEVMTRELEECFSTVVQ